MFPEHSIRKIRFDDSDDSDEYQIPSEMLTITSAFESRFPLKEEKRDEKFIPMKIGESCLSRQHLGVSRSKLKKVAQRAAFFGS